MAKPPDAKDPRYRLYRMATYAVYLLVVCGFSVLVIVSVFRSASGMMPKVPKPAGPHWTNGRCVSAAKTLWNELEAERQHFSRSKTSEALQTHWQEFRLDWLGRVRKTQAQCGPGSHRALAELFLQLEHVENLYTTSAVQYGNEIAPSVAAFRHFLAKASAK